MHTQILHKFKTMNIWSLLWLTVIISEILTAVIVGILSTLFFGRFTLEFLITGVITSFIVATLVASIIFYFVKHLRKIEQNLRESEEKYRTILESIEDGYFEVDLRGNLKFFNEALCKISAYSRDELMGLNNRDYSSKEAAKKIYLIFNQIYLTGKPAKDIKYEVFDKNNKKRILEISSSLMKDHSDFTVGFRGIARDVTERLRAEKEKLNLKTKLQQAQKMEVIGTLAGGVAHDLNNVLAGLVSYPELLLMQIPIDNPWRKYIETIKKSGEKAAAIVQDLLTLARRGVTVMEVINFNEIINEYLKSPEFKKLKKTHPGIQVKSDLETNLLNISGSPVHLNKSLMNLVSNAAEAMLNGGTIYISTNNVYVDKPIKGYENIEEGNYVKLTVSDTGLGITLLDIEKIFEPFYTKKVMGRSGTGLGMTVVWGTVKDHRGYIDVHSREGNGTTFTLYFPVTRQALVNDSLPISVNEYKGKGEFVLIIDDVEEQRIVASEILKNLGYSVKSVSGGDEAIEYMKNNSADLLLIDMIMEPGIDGFETYKRILQLHPSQRAIITSGFSETERVKETQKLGAGDFIKKPYLMEKIGMAVRRELDKNN